MIGAIVLAAGSSRRFGDDKRRAVLPNGKMVVQQSLETALAAFDEVLLVLRHGDAEFAEELRALLNNPNLSTFCAPESALGMGHSLANSIGRVEAWQGAFVFLADMPHLRAETLEALKDEMAGTRIVVPVYDGDYGHPVGFDRAFFEALGGLKGDRGARVVIEGNREAVVEVAVDDVGVLKDVDVPADLLSS